MTKEELITRIKKLLALSDSSNPNEAAIALSRAQKLMQQYHIEMSELEDSVISERVIETVRGMKNIKHISQIGHILTKVLGVEFIYHTNQYGTVNKVNMIGPKDSLESCEYIFVILTRSVMAAKKLYSEKIYCHIVDYILGSPNLREGLCQNKRTKESFEHFEKSKDFCFNDPYGFKGFKAIVDSLCILDPQFNYVFNKLKRELPESFMFGYFKAIYGKVAEFVQDDETKEAIEKFKSGNHQDLKIHRTRTRRIHADAYNDGCEQGEKVNLMNAVNGQGGVRKLLK